MSLINRILAVLLAHGAIDLARELVATWGRATPTGDDPSPAECDDPVVVMEIELNQLKQTSRVSLFAAETVDGGSATLKLGSNVHISDFRLPVAAAVSTRDHLVATGLATRGAKVTVGLRNQGVAASTVNGYVVIEPV